MEKLDAMLVEPVPANILEQRERALIAFSQVQS